MDKVDEMPAGRELDALICVRVMKTHKVWDRVFATPAQLEWGKLVDVRNGALRGYDDIPEYSSDIGAAWEVLRKLETKGLRACIWPFPKVVNLYREDTGDIASEAHGETVPLAICRAALKTLEDE